MIEDNYKISSNFRPSKKAVTCNVKRFFEEFNDFYIKVLANDNPDLPHTICDPYGFALLCEDYQDKQNNEIYFEEDISCQKSFEGGIRTDFDSVYKYKFPFKILLDLLFRAYYFDYNLAIKIYNMQHSAFDIFNQIMNGHGYVINRLAPQKKKVRQLINHAQNSKLSLNDKKHISVPYKHRVCDGKSWPCIISPNYLQATVKKCNIGGFGEGLFVIADDKYIIDVLKINDLWLIDTPLENRLKFGNNCREYEVIPYMKAYSWRSALDAGKIMKCRKKQGILVRPCWEDYFNTTWFEWSPTSLIYCCLINGKLQIANRRSSKPDFYTLEGDLGEINPYEERIYERIWLDDFDIKEFQKILELRD